MMISSCTYEVKDTANGRISKLDVGFHLFCEVCGERRNLILRKSRDDWGFSYDQECRACGTTELNIIETN